jgi:hypothetical protein
LKRQHFFERERKKEKSIRKQKYTENAHKKKSAKQSYLAVEGVTEQMKNNKQPSDDKAKKKKRVEQSKDKTHRDIFC